MRASLGNNRNVFRGAHHSIPPFRSHDLPSHTRPPIFEWNFSMMKIARGKRRQVLLFSRSHFYFPSFIQIKFLLEEFEKFHPIPDQRRIFPRRTFLPSCRRKHRLFSFSAFDFDSRHSHRKWQTSPCKGASLRWW